MAAQQTLNLLMLVRVQPPQSVGCIEGISSLRRGSRSVLAERC